MATYWENSCSFGLRHVSWYKYLIVSLVFSHLGFWSGNLFLIAPFPDLCLLVPFQMFGHKSLYVLYLINLNVCTILEFSSVVVGVKVLFLYSTNVRYKEIVQLNLISVAVIKLYILGWCRQDHKMGSKPIYYLFWTFKYLILIMQQLSIS